MARKTLNALRLSDEQRRQLREELHAFFLDEMDEDMGLIKQEAVLSFIEERIAPLYYNKALDDAAKWAKAMLENAENDYYLLYKEG